MVLHVLGLRDRVAREAAREATLDLADRTCHELGNVAFVVANERRNLASHIDLLERFLDEEPASREAAAQRAGIDAASLARFDHALAREYAERGIDPALELRRSATMARDVCRQIAICSDYITLTVRELDGFLKQSELPVVLGPIAAGEVFDEATALLAPRLEAADATVERPEPASGPVRVTGDRRLLAHAVVNLLKNGVEAASVAGIDPRIILSARIEGETAWLEVADNGPGIAEADRRLIFEDGFTTKGAGRGQGLAIVRESVRLQGGRIEVSARIGGGTVFAIGLPAAV
jgi:signal transduction histidine kinase